MKTYSEFNRDIKRADKFKSEKIDEGILTAAMGAMVGPKITKALCNALGITKGPLYDLLNSSTFARALMAYVSF